MSKNFQHLTDEELSLVEAHRARKIQEKAESVLKYQIDVISTVAAFLANRGDKSLNEWLDMEGYADHHSYLLQFRHDVESVYGAVKYMEPLEPEDSGE